MNARLFVGRGAGSPVTLNHASPSAFRMKRRISDPIRSRIARTPRALVPIRRTCAM